MSNFMSLEEMRQHEWTVSWSGGKDSTATIILMHENNIPIKEIIYVRMMYDDTLPATLPVMAEFVDRTTEIFKSWGYKVKIVNSYKTATDLMNRVFKRSKYKDRIGKRTGFLVFNRVACEFTGVKTATIKKVAEKDAWEMIGYAADETDRIHRLGGRKQSIMVTLDFQEKDTFELCRKYNMLSPLYDLGVWRDGCFFCPNSAKRERELLKQTRPDLVALMYKEFESMEVGLEMLKTTNNWAAEYFKDKELEDQYCMDGFEPAWK